MNELLLAWHGDDLTGSVDVLEVVAACGLRTVLFLRPPTPADLLPFGPLDAVGVAGLTRTLSVDGIRSELATAVPSLAALKPRVLHLKVCSTFDSSPDIGSIGAAIEVAASTLNATVVPLLVGAPTLGRYVVFGNLFARSGWDSPPYRLDRHPTMAHHPTTPMDEADVLRHLARQTDLPAALLDVLILDQGVEAATSRLEVLAQAGARIVHLDVLGPRHLTVLGELIWERATAAPPLLVVGSAGVEHALAAHWLETGDATAGAPASIGPAEAILAVVGSCSPVSWRQIRRAVSAGFTEVELPIGRLDAAGLDEAVVAATDAVATTLRSGRSVVVHTGGAHPSGGRAVPSSVSGEALGRVIAHALEGQLVRRVAVAGGDTSGHVLRTLRVDSLQVAAPFQPTMPLLHARSGGRQLDVELVTKGGQTGGTDFFLDVLEGRPYQEETG